MRLSQKRLADWYWQMAQQLQAGLSLTEVVRDTVGGPSEADKLAWADALASSLSPEEVWLGRYTHFLPEVDARLLMAAAQAGALPQILQELSEQHRLGAKMVAQLCLACLGSVLTLQMAIWVSAVLAMIDWEVGFLWDGGTFWVMAGGGSLLLWGTVAALLGMQRWGGNAVVLVGSCIPGMRAYLRHRDWAHVASVLGVSLRAGISVVKAWQWAGQTTSFAAVRRACAEVERVVSAGQEASGAMRGLPVFAQEWVGLYQAGERSGQLDDNLLMLAQKKRAQAQAALQRMGVLYPVVLIVCVCIWVGWQIISFYSGYWEGIMKMME